MSGLRKMTGIERKRMRALAGSLLFGGELPDDIAGEIQRWLVSRGWEPVAAKQRAKETVRAAQGDQTP